MLAVVTLLERIQWCVDQRADSARALSLKAKLSPGTVGKILERSSERVSQDTLKAIALGAGVSERWLILGEGTPEASDEEAPQHEAGRPVWSRIAGWPESEAQVRRDHPEWSDERAWSAARGAGPYMAPVGGVQPIHIEELYRMAVRLGAGGDLRAQVDASRVRLGAEVQALRDGTMAHPVPPPPEKAPRRGRR